MKYLYEYVVLLDILSTAGCACSERIPRHVIIIPLPDMVEFQHSSNLCCLPDIRFFTMNTGYVDMR